MAVVEEAPDYGCVTLGILHFTSEPQCFLVVFGSGTALSSFLLSPDGGCDD